MTPSPGSDPRLSASPKLKIPPSDPTSQYPWPSGVGTTDTTGRDGVTPNPGSDPKYPAAP